MASQFPNVESHKIEKKKYSIGGNIKFCKAFRKLFYVTDWPYFLFRHVSFLYNYIFFQLLSERKFASMTLSKGAVPVILW